MIPGESPSLSPGTFFGRDELVEEIVIPVEGLIPTAPIGASGIDRTSIALAGLYDGIKWRSDSGCRFQGSSRNCVFLRLARRTLFGSLFHGEAVPRRRQVERHTTLMLCGRIRTLWVIGLSPIMHSVNDVPEVRQQDAYKIRRANMQAGESLGGPHTGGGLTPACSVQIRWVYVSNGHGSFPLVDSKRVCTTQD